MPASENTWRDLKTLHVVFGFTGLLLLIATVALFAADHRREWKRYQRKMRDIDVRLTDWQIAAEEARTGEAARKAIEDELSTAKANPPSKEAFESFITELNRYNAEQGGEGEHPRAAELKSRYDEVVAATDPEGRIKLRQSLVDAMTSVAQRARFEEDRFLSQRKFKAADYDEKRANYDLAIRDGLVDKLPAIQAEVDQEKAARDELSIAYEKAAAHRKSLDASIRNLNADITAATEKLDEAEAGQKRLATALSEREATYFTSEFPFLGKKWLEFPVLDAFNSPLKIDTRWTKNLTMPNGGFGQVRRFDRCTTCHMAMEKTAPGSAVDPLYEDAHLVEFALNTPESEPATEAAAEGEEAPAAPSLLSVYGIDIASSGLVESTSVTVRHVLPNSLAATAKVVSGSDTDGIKVGDVLRFVGNDEVLSLNKAQEFLLSNVKWGQPVRVRVERGLPQPFSSHPRLDLFVGSMSPHKVSVFGCTVCHEGQGSATEFKWVSHSPNDPLQEKEWVKKYGWFNNHHWIYPMQPARFSESTCLKCHHDVVELELSPNYAEPPAPKLMAGYHLIREYGCFGCHEINGYNSPTERVGPDMRLEPNYYAAAAQLKVDPNYAKLGDSERGWIEELVRHPENTETRHRLLEFLKNDKTSGTEAALTPASHELIVSLEDIETPGTLRKVGPSLRHLSSKVGREWLYDWIRDPTHFRPSTRMPKFFELWKHLDSSDPAELGQAQKFERIEILGLVTYLLKSSQPIDLESPDAALPAEVSEEQVASGKVLFETRGCLACHSHRDFPNATATHGPELSNIGDKFRGNDVPNSRAWLYTWLKNPSLYHPRTKMPDLILDPYEKDGTTIDPAADIAAYLLASSNNWEPAAASRDALTPDATALNDLVKEHLRTKLYQADAFDAVDKGRVPEHLRASLTGSEAYLDGEMTEESKLMYIGHKTVSKYGCYACHDIPGFEGAKPIGTGLADWGRKDPSRLAFEHIAEYISHGHGHGGHAAHGAAASDEHADDHAAEADSSESMSEKTPEKPFDESFYMQKLTEHDRTGFVWQKLKEPRSYDFKKTRNKDSYNDRLRMPAFPFTPEERESVVTFVLGLVAEPPAPEFVYHADERQQAIIAGHKALTKFNCVGCHIVEPEKWSIEAPAGSFEAQVSDPNSTFPFMPHHFTTDQVAKSSTPNPTRGTVEATLSGMPEISSDSGIQRVLDEEGDEISEDTEYDPATLIYPFELWEPALLEGNAYQVGVVPLEIPASWIKQREPTFGGDLTKWLLPRAVELEKEANPQADGKQAYGWLPPPLIGEGLKVQTDWLHDFLLEPFMIRPAVLMRMPKFNMSSQEATDLANYFAAKDNAAYPYAADPATDTKRLAKEDATYSEKLANLSGDKPRGETRFDHVMNIVTSSNYCVQCHIVGDFEPKTSDRAKAPDLSAVNRRLRPDYLRRWIANPKQILPYTPMPVNVKYNAEDAENLGGVEQSLYVGSSLEQLEGLVDLLMNYPQYTKGRASVADLVPPAAGATATESSSVEPQPSDNVQ